MAYGNWNTVKLLILFVLVVTALAVAAVFHRRLASGEPDMGTVSERWLAEYRADSSRPSR
jgi:hypothetical protein